ncbi:hypothetical protein TNCV_1312581 [Trichonephila clavipes]|nr:hypothetical protein TNCV_1312581 [Trichonephila clavipes]
MNDIWKSNTILESFFQNCDISKQSSDCGEPELGHYITFRSWTAKNRLKRSSTLQFDNDLRNDINLNHTSFDIIQVPCFPVNPPTSTKIILGPLESCTKKEPKDTIQRKGMDTIIDLMRPHLTDGSSDSECNRGGSGVFIKYPDNTQNFKAQGL